MSQPIVALRDVFLHEAFHFRWALDDAGTTDLFHDLSPTASVLLAVFTLWHWLPALRYSPETRETSGSQNHEEPP